MRRNPPNRRRFATCASTAVASILALVACTNGPYVTSKVPRPGLSTSDVSAILRGDVKFDPESSNVATTSVSFEAAEQYGRFLQDAYAQALARRSNVRGGLNLATLVTGFATLGLEAVETGGDTTLITGLTAAALGIGGQALLTRNHEAAYSLGARQINCVLTAATNHRPSSLQYDLMNAELVGLERDLEFFGSLATRASRDSEARMRLHQSKIDRLRSERNGLQSRVDEIGREIDRADGRIASNDQERSELRSALDDLDAQLTALPTASEQQRDSEARIGLDQSEIDRLRSERNDLQSRVDEIDREIDEANGWIASKDQERSELRSAIDKRDEAAEGIETQLISLRQENNRKIEEVQLLGRRADRILDLGGVYRNKFSRLGDQLLNKIEEIRWEVNDAVRRTEPDLIQLNSNLRSIANNRLSFANISLDSRSLVPQPARIAFSQPNQLQEEWASASTFVEQINERIEIIRETLEVISDRPTLSFPENAFSDCSTSDVRNISETTSITLSPSSFDLGANFSSGTVMTNIAGGRAPISVQNNLNNALISGNVLVVTLTSDQVTPGGQPIQTTVSDLFGHSAVFTINMPPEPPAEREGTGQEDMSDEQPETRFVTNADVAMIQTFLMQFPDGNGGLWLRGLADDASQPIPGLKEELDGGNGFTDRGFGVVSRRSLQYFIKHASLSTFNGLVNDGAGAALAGCPDAIVALQSTNANLSIDPGDPSSNIYPADEIETAEELSIDRPLIDFVLRCGIVK